MGRIIIMGATSGIGMEVAKLFIADGWTVGVAGRRGEPLTRLAALAPGRVFARQIDITGDDAAARLMELVEECGGMDVYLHSSGIGYNNPTLRPDDELRTAETNATGFVRMTGAAFNYFVAKGGGHVAAITSIAGARGLGAAPAYSATKRMQSTYLQALKQQAAMRAPASSGPTCWAAHATPCRWMPRTWHAPSTAPSCRAAAWRSSTGDMQSSSPCGGSSPARCGRGGG